MPHLLLERVRASKDPGDKIGAGVGSFLNSAKSSKAVVYSVELLDVIAAFLFLVGSFCLLPEYVHDVEIFLFGCGLFIAGSMIYCVICTISLVDVFMLRSLSSVETAEHGMYLMGSWLFLFGSILYLPVEKEPETQILVGATTRLCLQGSFWALMDRAFWANILFMVGSALFLMAAFTNAHFQRRSDEWNGRMLTAVTSFFMLGSLLFIVGCVAFFPQLHCGDGILTLGAWNFISGSAFYLAGAMVSVARTHWLLQCDELMSMLGPDTPLAPDSLLKAPVADQAGTPHGARKVPPPLVADPAERCLSGA